MAGKYFFTILYTKLFLSRQTLKKNTVCVKSSDSIFFLLGLSPNVNKFEEKK